MPAKPCPPNCRCGKHVRSAVHNTRIGIAVSLTAQSKKARGIRHMTREAEHG